MANVNVYMYVCTCWLRSCGLCTWTTYWYMHSPFESAVRPNGRNAHCVMGSSGRWNVVVGSGDGRGRVLCRATLAWLSLFLVDSQRLDNSSAALSLLLFKRCFQMTTEYARICFFISVIAGYHTVKLRCQKLTKNFVNEITGMIHSREHSNFIKTICCAIYTWVRCQNIHLSERKKSWSKLLT